MADCKGKRFGYRFFGCGHVYAWPDDLIYEFVDVKKLLCLFIMLGLVFDVFSSGSPRSPSSIGSLATTVRFFL